jgi:hypothetical protein
MANNVNIKVTVDDAALEKLVNKAQQSAKIIRGGFDIATGAAAVFGTKSAEAMEKLANRSILVANTFNGLEDLIEGLGKQEGFLKAAQKVGVGKEAVEGFAKALPGIGIAAAVALPLLSSLFENVSKKAVISAEDIAKVSKKFTEQKTQVDALVSEYNNSNTSLERQKEILNELSEISPNYFGGAIKNTEDLKKAQDKYNAALLQEITLTANKAKIQEIVSENVNELAEIQNQINTLATEEGALRSAGFFGAGSTPQRKAELLKRAKELANAKIQGLKEEQKEILAEQQKQIKPYQDAANQAALALSGLGGTTQKVNTEKQRVQKEANKKELDTLDKLQKDTKKLIKDFREGGFEDEYLQYIQDTEKYVSDGAFVPSPEMIGEAGDQAIKATGEVEDRLAKERLKKREQAAKERLQSEQKDFTSTIKNLQMISEGVSAIQDLSSQLFSNALANIDREFEERSKKLEKFGEQALAQAGDNALERVRIEKDLKEQQLKLEEEADAKRKELLKKQALTDLSLTTIQIGVETALSILKAETLPERILNGVLGAAALATAIAAKSQVMQLRRGGTLFGPSHEEGGIRGTGAFGGIEVEGGEMIINKRSARMYGPLLSRINQAGGGVPLIPTKAANGGVLPGSMMSDLDYDRLASAIASTPVRAYVVTQDITDSQDKLNLIQRKANLF